MTYSFSTMVQILCQWVVPGQTNILMVQILRKMHNVNIFSSSLLMVDV
jgi:hypothetical protein